MKYGMHYIYSTKEDSLNDMAYSQLLRFLNEKQIKRENIVSISMNEQENGTTSILFIYVEE